MVLAVLLSSYIYLEPTITGFIVEGRQASYSDSLSLVLNDSGEYLWRAENYGDMRSVRIGGSLENKGSAKVYIEDGDRRHLIFDSNLLEEKDVLDRITGLVVKEENKTKPNHPPVWQSEVERFVVDYSVEIDLEEYFYDKDGDMLSYSFDDVSNLKILLNGSILMVSNENDISGNRTLSVYASDDDVTKKKNVVLVLEAIAVEVNETSAVNITNETVVNMSETNVSEHIQNLTVLNETKSIDIRLEYKTGSVYDVDDNGIETTTGVIDLSVEGSGFNWEADESNLCTLWETYSVEEEESVIVCYGGEECCGSAGLMPSRESWNEVFYSYYGQYGAGWDNVIYAQVYHYDATEDIEIYNSRKANLTAMYYLGAVKFDDVCVETCALFGFNSTSYNLVFEINDTVLYLDSVDYSVVEEVNVTNNMPLLVKEISNITIDKDENYTIDLSEYFSDTDGDALQYGAYETENLSVVIDEGVAVIIPDENFIGSRYMFFKANDSLLTVVSNVFRVEVVEEVVVEETLEQLKAEIGKTVKWIKRSDSKTISIPDYAFNLSVEKVIGREKTLIEKSKIKVRHDSRLKSLDEFEVDNKLEKLYKRIEAEGVWEEIESLVVMKEGLVSEFASENGTAVVVDETADSFEVGYETDAPEVYEEEIDEYNKKVTVSSDIGYTDVLAYTTVSESPRDAIRLYWYKEEGKVDVTNDELVNLTFVDENEDGLVESVRWNVPHLSNQTFEISIVILNVQSYPTVGGEWEVRFETSGTGNLSVMAVDGTSYSEEADDISGTVDDVRLLELRCGNETLEPYYLVELDDSGNLITGAVVGVGDRLKEGEEEAGMMSITGMVEGVKEIGDGIVSVGDTIVEKSVEVGKGFALVSSNVVENSMEGFSGLAEVTGEVVSVVSDSVFGRDSMDIKTTKAVIDGEELSKKEIRKLRVNKTISEYYPIKESSIEKIPLKDSNENEEKIKEEKGLMEITGKFIKSLIKEEEETIKIETSRVIIDGRELSKEEIEGLKQDQYSIEKVPIKETSIEKARENQRFSVSWKSDGNLRFPADTKNAKHFSVSTISMKSLNQKSIKENSIEKTKEKVDEKEIKEEKGLMEITGDFIRNLIKGEEETIKIGTSRAIIDGRELSKEEIRRLKNKTLFDSKLNKRPIKNNENKEIVNLENNQNKNSITTSSIYLASRNLFATASETLSVNSLTSLSESFILDENLLSFFNFSALSKNAFTAKSDQSSLNSFIVFSNSSGKGIVIVPILISPSAHNENEFIKIMEKGQIANNKITSLENNQYTNSIEKESIKELLINKKLIKNTNQNKINNQIIRFLEIVPSAYADEGGCRAAELEERDYSAAPGINNYKNYDACLGLSNNSLIGFIVMPESVKNNSVSLNLKHKNKRANMNSFIVAETSFEIFEVHNSSIIQLSDLVNLLLNSSEQRRIFLIQLSQDFFNPGSVDVHIESHHSLNSSKLIGFILPDLISLDVFSMDSTTSLTTESLTSLVSSSGISDISRIFFFNCSSSISSSVSENACLATEDQLIQSVLDIFSFNFSGTDNVMVPILDLQNNYLYYVYAKDIFKSFEIQKDFEDAKNAKHFSAPFDLEQCLNHYQKSIKDKEIINLENKKPIKENEIINLKNNQNEKSIKKEQLLKNANKNSIKNIIKYLEIIPSAYAAEGYRTVVVNGKEYALLTEAELEGHSYRVAGWYYEGYNCNDTGYHTVNVLTAGVHNQLFRFNEQEAMAHNLAAEDITLNFPADENNSINFSSVLFNCSVSANNASNATLYSDYNGSWQAFQTNDIDEVSNITTFIRNITSDRGNQFVDSSFKWNCYFCNTTNNCSFASANFTFSSWDLGSYSATMYDGNISLNASMDNYTVLLLHMNGTHEYSVNETSDETGRHMFNFSGDANISTAQSKFGGTSAVFDGTGDYLVINDSDDWDFGSDDFTIDMWVNFDSLGTQRILGQGDDANNKYALQFHSTRGIEFWNSILGVNEINFAQGSTSGWSTNTWYHIALVRNGNDFTIYREGSSVANASDSDAVGSFSGEFTIGTQETTYLDGYLDELHISKGIARWDGNFSPPAREYPLYNASGIYTSQIYDAGSYVKFKNISWGSETENASIDDETMLLLHFNGTHEYSVNETSDETGRHKFNFSGNANISTTQSKFGGTGAVFNGTGDYLVINDSDDWDFGTGDFTIDYWVYFSTLSASGDTPLSQDDSAGAPNRNYQAFTAYSNGDLYFWTNKDSTVVADLNTGTGKVTTGQWYHVAVTRAGNNFRLFLDGAMMENKSTADSMPDVGTDLWVGKVNAAGHNPLNGYIDELRISKGTARWTGNFTPPQRAYGGYYTNVSIETRTSDDGSSWGSWTGQLNPSGTIDDSSRFIQYRVNLTTNDTSYTPYLTGQSVIMGFEPEGVPPVINGTLNRSLSNITIYDVINATFNATDDLLDAGMVIVNDTGVKRYFNFSLSGTSDEFSQNFTITSEQGAVINITGWVNDSAGNEKINDTIITVVDTVASVTLNEPRDNNNSINFSKDVVFNCSVLDNDGIRNITLYSDHNGSWQEIEFQNLTGLENSTTFTRNILGDKGVSGSKFIDSGFKWNCWVYDIANNSYWAGSNFTFSSWSFNSSYANTTTDGINITLTANESGQYPNTTGYYYSKLFDAGSYVKFKNISWDNRTIVNANVVTNVSMQTRTSDDGITWTAWSGNHTNPSGTIDNSSRFIQYKAILYTNETNITPFLTGKSVNISYEAETVPPVINGTLNRSLSNITRYDVINATFNATNDLLVAGMIIVNDTGENRYFNFSLSGADDEFSQNFTITSEQGAVINITGWVNDSIGNVQMNDTVFTVADYLSSVVLNNPVDNNNSVNFSKDIAFNCSVLDNDGIRNVSLYSDHNGSWQEIEFQNLTGLENSTTFTRNILGDKGVSGSKFIDSGFKWNCWVYDIANNSYWAGSNFTFSSWSFNSSYANTTTDGINITLTANESGQYPNTTGYYYSKLFDAGSYVKFKNITWDNVTIVNANVVTNISMQTRTSDDGSTWTAWSGNHTNPSETVDVSARFIQYVATFYTNHSNFTPTLMGQSVNISQEPETVPPVVNGTLNISLSSIKLYDIVNATFNATDDLLDYGMVIVNDTGVKRYFNFSLSGTADEFSQNFSVSCADCVVNVTGIVEDSAGISAMNDTIFTVGAGDTCSCPSSGDWAIDCSDNCAITTDCNMDGNSVSVSGEGNLTINSMIYGFDQFAVHNKTCVVSCIRAEGCFG